jgi:hypothetical protein
VIVAIYCTTTSLVTYSPFKYPTISI